MTLLKELSAEVLRVTGMVNDGGPLRRARGEEQENAALDDLIAALDGLSPTEIAEVMKATGGVERAYADALSIRKVWKSEDQKVRLPHMVGLSATPIEVVRNSEPACATDQADASTAVAHLITSQFCISGEAMRAMEGTADDTAGGTYIMADPVCVSAHAAVRAIDDTADERAEPAYVIAKQGSDSAQLARVVTHRGCVVSAEPMHVITDQTYVTGAGDDIWREFSFARVMFAAMSHWERSVGEMQKCAWGLCQVFTPRQEPSSLSLEHILQERATHRRIQKEGKQPAELAWPVGAGESQHASHLPVVVDRARPFAFGPLAIYVRDKERRQIVS